MHKKAARCAAFLFLLYKSEKAQFLETELLLFEPL
jgi:hypothetical protein